MITFNTSNGFKIHEFAATQIDLLDGSFVAAIPEIAVNEENIQAVKTTKYGTLVYFQWRFWHYFSPV